MVFLGILFVCVCLVPILNALLIILGRIKTPVLQSFERYGEAEIIYHPLLQLLIWTGLLIGGARIYAGIVYDNLYALFDAPLVMGLVFALWRRYADQLRPRFDRHLILPQWYRELLQRTSRYERRRIAYMWLHLPQNTRAALDTDTTAFLHWADLVIMGNVLEEDPRESSLLDKTLYNAVERFTDQEFKL
jgi:hypothetical protein